MIAEALKHMLAAGMTHEAIVAAVADMEASAVRPDPVADRRRAYDRERKRKSRVSGGSPVESADNAEQKVSSLEVFPQTPFPNPNFENLPPIVPQNGFDLSGHDEPEAEPPVTPDELLEAWNETADQCGLPKARMTPERRRLIASRIRQHSIDDIRLALGAIARARWMHGENDKNWRANLKFFLRPGIITELSEGTYDRTH